MIQLSVQTDKNPVIIISELALKLLRQSFKYKLGFRPTISKPELDELFKKIEASIMTLKYSYMALNDLINHPEINTTESLTEQIRIAIQPAITTPSTNKLVYSVINWCINIYMGIKRRLSQSNNELGSGVDLKVVRIRNIQKTGELLLTRAYDDLRD